jgi:hypothetical protein
MKEELQPTPYMSKTLAMAESIDFRRVGIFADGKSRFYRVRYEFWLSPDCSTLAEIGSGKVATVGVDATWLFTRLVDGRCLVTVDEPKASEYDLSGLRDNRLYPGLDFQKLLARHRERIANAESAALEYTGSDSLANHREFMRHRVARLVEKNYARLIDEQRGVWSYTIFGACVLSIRANWKAFRRHVQPDK